MKESTPHDEPETVKPEEEQSKKPNKQNKFLEFIKSKNGIILISVSVAVLLVVGLFAWPTTRYAILGNFVKKQIVVSVTDSATSKPVSEVDVFIGSQVAKTDSDGNATLNNVAVGKYNVIASKKYFNEAKQDVTVKVFQETKVDLSVQATGRQVPVKVVNKISSKPVLDATITAGEASAKTDDLGEAVLVVPADAETVDGKVTSDGFNETAATITVTEEQTDKNKFSITPAGKLYFLSKRTGTVNVMKSNLDGSDSEVVVKGTGKEDSNGTVMLASRDWKYLALKARREGDDAKLYLIDTSNDKMTVMDEGDASFDVKGWSNHHFIYTVERENVKFWESKKFALKTFNATNHQIVTIDESSADGDQSGYNYQWLTNVYIFGDIATYTKFWSSSRPNKTFDNFIYSFKNDGSNKKELKKFNSIYASAGAKLYEPKEEYFSVFTQEQNKNSFWEYEANTGDFKQAADINDEKFSKFYPTFLVSPSAKMTFWYEPRDGKNSLFTGDDNAKDANEVATLSDLTPYGWYTDDYLLTSKNGSELFIMPRDASDAEPLKVTDYHKPNYDFSGYGYGYGGF